jgi:hypothetical protein
MGRHNKTPLSQKQKQLNITYHQANANQNYNEVSPYPIRMANMKKTRKIKAETNINEDVDKEELSYTIVENVN